MSAYNLWNMTLATIFFRLLGSTSVYNNIINNIYIMLKLILYLR